MAIDSTTRKQSFNLDGSTVDFDFTFWAIKNSPEDIKCKTIDGDGAVTDLTYSDDYTVSVNVGGEGGTVTLDDAGSSGSTLLVYRDTENLQESDYNDYNQFPADTVEADFDRRTMKSQELEDEISRAVKVSITSDLSNIELPTPEAGKALVWNDDEDGLTNATIAGSSEAASYATIAQEAAEDAESYATIASGSTTTAASHATTALGASSSAESYSNIALGATEIDSEPSSDTTASGLKSDFTAADAMIFGDVGYINTAGTINLPDADAIASAKCVVMCADASIDADSSGTFLLLGIARNDAWDWTPGGLLYLTTTATTGSTISQSAPSGEDDCVVVLGVATHADRAYFNPQLVIVEYTE